MFGKRPSQNLRFFFESITKKNPIRHPHALKLYPKIGLAFLAPSQVSVCPKVEVLYLFAKPEKMTLPVRTSGP